MYKTFLMLHDHLQQRSLFLKESTDIYLHNNMMIRVDCTYSHHL